MFNQEFNHDLERCVFLHNVHFCIAHIPRECFGESVSVSLACAKMDASLLVKFTHYFTLLLVNVYLFSGKPKNAKANLPTRCLLSVLD